MLENMIETNNMLNHKILLFLLEPGQISVEIRGLIANKFMAKYQRPCLLLTKTNKNGIITYEGSGRGYTKTGINSFKKILEQCPEVIYV
jgi:single-stranded DNA-specific DHH superfamily exonuclease